LSTSFDILYSKFFDKIQKNGEFFQYYNLTEYESLQLAKERAKGLFEEAIAMLTLDCTPDVNFLDYDTSTEMLNVDVTKNEVDIIASLMFEKFLEKDIAKLTAFSPHFTASELKAVLSPANERSTFVSKFNMVQNKNKDMVDNYKSRDRLTGKLKVLDFPL
jgi:hypothetical protein